MWTVPLSYENDISEHSLNIWNVQFCLFFYFYFCIGYARGIIKGMFHLIFSILQKLGNFNFDF